MGGFDGAVYARAPRRRRWGWWVAGAVVAGLVTAAALIHLDANRAYDAAAADETGALTTLSSARATLETAAADGAAAAAAAASIVEDASDQIADPGARDSLALAGSALAETVAAGSALLDEPVPQGSTGKPVWPWELTAAASEMAATAVAASALATQAAHDATAVDDGRKALLASAVPLYESVAAKAAALEAANVSARATVVLDLRDAAASAAGQEAVGSGAVLAFDRLRTAAEALVTSSQAELAEKAGPLMDTRLVVEAYARSIAGGVVLDFDWAPRVIGIGGSAGMAGTATWNTGRGGFSTITLSDSVAANWPSADARALVAHEVGHSITSKCSDMFDSGDQAANEQWATAWAISMGHTASGNGTQAYGYPPQELIDIAATCR